MKSWAAGVPGRSATRAPPTRAVAAAALVAGVVVVVVVAVTRTTSPAIGVACMRANMYRNIVRTNTSVGGTFCL